MRIVVVTITLSARRAAISPMIGRFALSRSPGQPKTRISLPLAKGRYVCSNFSKLSGEWAKSTSARKAGRILSLPADRYQLNCLDPLLDDSLADAERQAALKSGGNIVGVVQTISGVRTSVEFSTRIITSGLISTPATSTSYSLCLVLRSSWRAWSMP